MDAGANDKTGSKNEIYKNLLCCLYTYLQQVTVRESLQNDVNFLQMSIYLMNNMCSIYKRSYINNKCECDFFASFEETNESGI